MLAILSTELLRQLADLFQAQVLGVCCSQFEAQIHVDLAVGLTAGCLGINDHTVPVNGGVPLRVKHEVQSLRLLHGGSPNLQVRRSIEHVALHAVLWAAPAEDANERLG
eukprot:1007795-Heterocapsa_arctica.AAC.1